MIHFLPEDRIKRILQESLGYPFVFLETTFFNRGDNTPLLFTDFTKLITFYPHEDVNAFFKELEENLGRGFWLCGYFSYEFGYFLEQTFSSFRRDINANFPLAWVGVCRGPRFVAKAISSLSLPNHSKDSIHRITNLKSNITFDEYKYALRKIKYYLEQGETYQVNFTFKIKFAFSGDVLDFYLNLRRTQPTSYMAFINTGNDYFLSFSPELFFRVKNKVIVTRPMKGTIRRGRFLKEDLEIASKFREDEKTRAENVMIVDLLRNDLGRIATKGTVSVSDLFKVEKYRTLFQMTSTIRAVLRDNMNLKNIFSSLFPCGSVTGAPKIRTMQIIKELEQEQRGIYTGAIGCISPKKEVVFNVAIRTVHLCGNTGEVGVGGGIVYDSLDKKEYKEAFLKANFLIRKESPFSLIETIRWENGFHLLELHLKRLKSSSTYFDIPLNLEEVKAELTMLEQRLRKDYVYKVRLVLNQEGKLNLEYTILEHLNYPLRAILSTKRVNSKDIYLYHKTTNRTLYDKELAKARREGFFEVIFLNEYNQITEGSFTNIFILIEEKMYTPPIECGLLGGVLRELLLKEKRVSERLLSVEDLLKAEKVFLGNSVRGLIEIEVFHPYEHILHKI